MTYNLMIVDDEHIIRQGLKTTLPWEEHDIGSVEIAEDGEAAIQILEDSMIDIVLTDIRMPNMDGLELAEYIREHHPSVKTIMLSGYDDFTYAQQAMKLGVRDYLLKPVDIDELLRVVGKLKEEMEEERKAEDEMKNVQRKNAIFSSIQEGDDLSIPFREEYVIALLSVKDQSTGQPEAVLPREKGLPSSITVVIDKEVQLTCFVTDEEQVVEKIHHSLQGKEMPFFHVLYPSPVKIAELNRITDRLVHFLYALPALESLPRLSIWTSLPEQERQLPSSFSEQWIQSISRLDGEKASDVLTDIFDFMRKEAFSYEEMKRALTGLLKQAHDQISSLFKQTGETTALDKFEQLRPWDESGECVKTTIMKDTIEMMAPFRDQQEDSTTWMIQRALTYIHTYYTSEIKAQEVADVINLSPNYFSSLFRQQTGEKFNDYIHNLRIEEAKTLLVETPFKVSDIAGDVGYQEYKYFVKIFKKRTGMTPTEYRKIMAIQS